MNRSTLIDSDNALDVPAASVETTTMIGDAALSRFRLNLLLPHGSQEEAVVLRLMVIAVEVEGSSTDRTIEGRGEKFGLHDSGEPLGDWLRRRAKGIAVLSGGLDDLRVRPKASRPIPKSGGLP
jgi:hypothetical protein